MEHWLFALMALTAMEIVLGIDNIVFIAVLTGRLPEKQRNFGRNAGLIAALVTRLLLLLALVWLTNPDNSFISGAVFTLDGIGLGFLLPDSLAADALKQVNEISGRDIVLLVGGLFLIGKSVHEIHGVMEGGAELAAGKPAPGFVAVLCQIALLDIVFSLDSVITAVGMAKELWIMITAIVVAVMVMLLFAKKISDFIEENPTLKMLALSFLILIGVVLVSDGVGAHINKGYIYFAMAFSILVEALNIRLRRKTQVPPSETVETASEE